MENTQEIPVEQENIREKRIAQIAPWQFKKGQSGNLKGRTPGKSMKEYAKEYLAKLSDEERDEYFEGMNKLDVWKMGEGNPKQDTELGGEVKMINVVVPAPVAKAFEINGTNPETGGSNPQQV